MLGAAILRSEASQLVMRIVFENDATVPVVLTHGGGSQSMVAWGAYHCKIHRKD